MSATQVLASSRRSKPSATRAWNFSSLGCLRYGIGASSEVPSPYQRISHLLACPELSHPHEDIVPYTLVRVRIGISQLRRVLGLARRVLGRLKSIYRYRLTNQ